MNGTDTLLRALRSRFPGGQAEISVNVDTSGRYHVTVTSAKFHGRTNSDRQSEVYEAFGSIPLPLVAKIVQIETRTPA